MKLHWTGEAQDDLANIQEYIAQDSPTAAARVVETIFNFTEEQLLLPRIGRPGQIAGTFELVVPKLPYTVPYRIEDDEIHILRVYHQSRLWPDML